MYKGYLDTKLPRLGKISPPMLRLASSSAREVKLVVVMKEIKIDGDDNSDSGSGSDTNTDRTSQKLKQAS
jgi:hypothetical protein